MVSRFTASQYGFFFDMTSKFFRRCEGHFDNGPIPTAQLPRRGRTYPPRPKPGVIDVTSFRDDFPHKNSLHRSISILSFSPTGKILHEKTSVRGVQKYRPSERGRRKTEVMDIASHWGNTFQIPPKLLSVTLHFSRSGNLDPKRLFG